MNKELSTAYITALTGDASTVVDWRLIDDRNKGVAAHTLRGSINDVYNQLVQYNQNGWGVFVAINALDGNGRELKNVQHIRTHVADLDDTLTSNQNYQKAINSALPPHFAVQTSPNKYHLYWLVEPYTGCDFFTQQQRKICQYYQADKHVIDATRVLRVPGFYHNKELPVPVTCWQLYNGQRYSAIQVQDFFKDVQIIEHFSTRSPLGTPELAAPSFEWLNKALYLLNPNDMGYDDWLSISAAYKQSGWSLTDENTLMSYWLQWCMQYSKNDEPENIKLWKSIKDTEVGWASFERKTNISAYMNFGTPQIPVVNDSTEEYAEILTPEDCKKYFKGCYFVERMGEIFTPSGRFMGSTQFNGSYGGKIFLLGYTNSKTTDEPWKAALRSTAFQIPKVDHVRFLPSHSAGEIIFDELGRKGLNTYLPAKVKHCKGDLSLWFQHMDKIMPDKNDQRIWFEYLAHCVKYPGYKIPWSPVFQSVEGIGKSIFGELLRHALGGMYVYSPKASELVNSSSKFNGWMRSRLMIIVDEIKVDERRELVEILKPMITDARIEVQSKGVDQEMEDNVSNWLFFSNYKDAIPINKNGRRYCIFYSAIQTVDQLHRNGMDDYYFTHLYDWLREGKGFEVITDWLLNYPIEKGRLPVRAPKTSSYDEALRIGRTALEVILDDLITSKAKGFKGGYVSATMLVKEAKIYGMKTVTEQTARTMLESKGYYLLGNTDQPVMGEDLVKTSLIYGLKPDLKVHLYEQTQNT